MSTARTLDDLGRLVRLAFERAGYGMHTDDLDPIELVPDGDYGCPADLAARPWGVLQTNNDGDQWLASEATYEDAIRNCRNCVAQPDKYAWWPLAILDIERNTAYEVEVDIRIRAVGAPAPEVAA